MKSMLNIILFLVGITVGSISAVVGTYSFLHRNDYEVAADELTFINCSLTGEVLASTLEGDTVVVYYTRPISPISEGETQNNFYYLTFEGFTSDSVVVRPY